MENMKWLTNDPAAALILRAADRKYEAALNRASRLPLTQKVDAIRKAREIRKIEYETAVLARFAER